MKKLLIVLLPLILLCGCTDTTYDTDVSSEEDKSTVTTSVVSSTTTTEVVTVPTTETTTTSTTTTTTTTTKKTTKSTTVKTTKKASSGVNNNVGRKIYKTKTGKKYHYDNHCNGGTYYETTLEDALASGLEPCKKCVLN